MNRTAPLFACLAALVTLTACPNRVFNNTRCEAITVAETGDLSADIVGTWDSWGTDSPLYFEFTDDRVVRTVEPPNQYAPRGLQGDGLWEIDGNDLLITWGDSEPDPRPISIRDNLLTELQDDGSDARSHARVECNGYGFP